MQLRRDDPVPVGVQLEWGLRGAILAGQLGDGERLPGLRELADDVGVNVNTVRAVYARLEADGLVETRHGSGSFVCRQPADAQLGWAEARERAEQAAHQAGLTPQQLAAALYMAEAPPPVRQDVAVRRALRAQIAVLEEALSELRAAHPELPAPDAPASRPAGPRILTEEELVAARDAVLDRLAEARVFLRKPDEPVAPPPETQQQRTPRTATSIGIAPA